LARVALLVHLLAVVFWVGGMAFAHFALRPALGALHEPAQRLTLLAGVLARFFAGVTVAIVLLLASGGYLMAIGAVATTRLAVHTMVGLGLVMVLVFVYIRVRPYPALRRAVSAEAWPTAAAAMGTIRKLVAFNLVVGAIVIAVVMLGR
jgi:uncharacterized membrane protein